MKKLTTLLLTAGLLAMTGCSGGGPAAVLNPPLSTKETCDRFHVLEKDSSFYQKSHDEKAKLLANIDDVTNRAAPELKDAFAVVREAAIEMAKDVPNEDSLKQLREKSDAAVTSIAKACGS